MLTFLAIASKKGISVDHYEDRAVGFLEKDKDGKMSVTRVELHPQISFSPSGGVIQEKLESLHSSAHEHCFIANSVKSKVDVVLQFYDRFLILRPFLD